MEFIDSHCHLHDKKYEFEPENYINEAIKSGVDKIICVGTDTQDSADAIDFAHKYPKNIWVSIGVHPHEADKNISEVEKLRDLAKDNKVVAIGECGLDYYYNHSVKKSQKKVLRSQIELAVECNLPLIFHVRDAYDDFWPIIDDYPGLTGVFHCFSAGQDQLREVLKRGFYVGVNGIVTFTKNKNQLDAFRAIPLDKMMLETDAPYLTPAPYRGSINTSKQVVTVAKCLSDLRGEPIERIASAATNNVKNLFRIT
jgi:TatD DNase family protein